MDLFNTLQRMRVYYIATTILLGSTPMFLYPIRGPYAWVDYLLWQPQEDGLQYAATVDANTLTVQEPRFTWSSGVRAGVGCIFGHTWDIGAVWTHLKQQSHVATVCTVPESVLVTPLTNFDESLATSTGTSYQLCIDFDTVDVDLGKGWFIWDGISLSPRMGVKWARIHQSQDMRYAQVTVPNTDINLVPIEIVRTNNFSGAGPYVTLQSMWALGKGFSLIGDISGSLLAGKLCTSSTPVAMTSPIATPIVNNTVHKIRPMARALLGIDWATALSDDAYELCVHAGYEMQWWPQQWNAVASVAQVQSGIRQSGDLSFQGLVLGLGFWF